MAPFVGELGRRAYCACHKAAKKLLGRSPEPGVSFLYCCSDADADLILAERAEWARMGRPAVNDSSEFPTSKAELFYGENVIDTPGFKVSNPGAESWGRYRCPEEAWRGFVEGSEVPPGWRNSGLHAVCWSRKLGQWTLSSWVWTSAAIARYYASIGDLARLKRVADALVDLQLEEGGWVVRHDFIGGRTTPMIAPNDSAYIAANALIPAYEQLGDVRYLDAAKRCAQWIMTTAQPDGLVYIGQSAFSGEWIADRNIVDVGFTAALFALLVEIADEAGYRAFLARFCDAYVSAFRNPDDGSFATSIDGDRSRRGGKFARGQAWALEGLVPAAQALGSQQLESLAEAVVGNLVSAQMPDGGWAYNLSHPLMGQDCKGVPVIAKSLAEWGVANGDQPALRAAEKALRWCRSHTLLSGEGAGGIYSFCLEGCVTHDLYSEAAFAYSSAYALETADIIGGAVAQRGGICRVE